MRKVFQMGQSMSVGEGPSAKKTGLNSCTRASLVDLTTVIAGVQ